MSIIAFDNVSLEFGAVRVLSACELVVAEGEKVGLIGRNGSGKTSVLHLIEGRLHPTLGRIVRRKELRIGTFEQDAGLPPELTPRQVVRGGARDRSVLQERITDLEHRLDSGDESVLEKYGTALDEFERKGGYTLEADVRRVLTGLGLRESLWDRPVGSLSGGERSRAALARLLLEDHDIVLLDEPTNHLDLDATEWLESHLASISQACVIVSHDREVLNRVAGRIVEIEEHTLRLWRGDYDSYVVQKEEDRKLRQKQREKQQREIARAEEFVRRWIGSTPKKARQAQVRRTKLDRLKRQFLRNPARSRRGPKISFDGGVSTGSEALITKDLSIGYNSVLVGEMNLFVRRGEKIGIVGPNGCGKSTLLRTFFGKHDPITGRFRWGAGVKIGFFGQQRIEFEEESSVLDVIWDLRPKWDHGQVRSYLARFLFIGDDVVVKRVVSLSGGEAQRLALAACILTDANVLLLDEPTNHLDIAAREALQTALNEFAGTLFLVTHDRHLLRAVTGRIWSMARDRVEDFDSVPEWESYRAQQKAAIDELVGAKYPASKRDSRKNRRVNRYKVARVEAAIARHELEVEQIETELAKESSTRDWQLLVELQQRREDALKSIRNLMEKWEALHT
jgi:ATP-binding cassette subfamily F protein 3